ncbi:MAG: hypothetical protein U0794_07585 [Isosphaeraceae bacterium]
MRASWFRTGLSGLLGAGVVAVLGALAMAQVPGTRTETAPPPGSVDVSTPQGRALLQARDELEIHRAQLDLRRELLKNGEMRLEQARRWKKHFEELFRDGKVTEDRVLAASDDVLMMEAHVAAERSELRLAEVRLKQAEHRVNSGVPLEGTDLRFLELSNRLQAIELTIDRLQHEVGRLRREQPNLKK